MTAPDEDKDGTGRRPGYASPPCLMHEQDPAWSGLSPDDSPEKRVARWRKAERQRLIAGRLDALIGDVAGRTVSAYWPFRGEPDLRAWMESVAERGGRCALPVVVEKGVPLVFRTWRKGEELASGVWNIPVPAGGAEVVPDVVIAPVVGFDRGAWRLGYGGGFFDRTLASLPTRPLAIGVGYAMQEVDTIYPQPHDIPMTVIATEQELISPPSGRDGGPR
ncbi:MAG TPA: 5-formyltetrahydrofolate cyclo-ligase [Alphaproteobacteria bacterium]|nr:5-formyltetrahydrofolate cyclo-ligase [Alphaproteobacteria bacterium]